MYGCRRVLKHPLQGPAFSCPPRAAAAARRQRSRVLRSRRSKTRAQPSTLGAAVHAACPADDNAVNEQEHPHCEEDVNPPGSRRGECDEGPDCKHHYRCDYSKIHGLISLTLNVTTDMFRES